MISEKDLIESGAELLYYQKGGIIFNQLDLPRYYYQLKEGSVAMNTLNEDGKEFTQGVFSIGQSFGEPPLFIDEVYPSSAVAMEDSAIYQLPKDKFLSLLVEKPKYSLNLITKMSEMLFFKSRMSSEISLYEPEHRILTLFDFLKTSANKENSPMKVELTRQQIANLTALRVETVIRAIKALEEKGKLEIKNRKVYY